jgi:hypothetical protein
VVAQAIPQLIEFSLLRTDCKNVFVSVSDDDHGEHTRGRAVLGPVLMNKYAMALSSETRLTNRCAACCCFFPFSDGTQPLLNSAINLFKHKLERLEADASRRGGELVSLGAR